jgi:hypothetical protein
MKKSELKEIIRTAFLAEVNGEEYEYNTYDDFKREQLMQLARYSDEEQLDDEDEMFMSRGNRKKSLGKIKEGVWSVLPARIPEFIQAVEDLKDEYHGVVGSDDVFNGLDAAISAAEELLMNTAEISEAKKDKEEDTEEIDVETDTEEVDTEMGDMGGMDTGNKGLTGGKKVIDDSLEAALEAARELGDEKLVSQIGNTITFFTRAHIVKNETGI